MGRITLYSLFMISFVAMVDASRPIYNIAHMVNTRSQIDQWLGYGANAIETDVSFDEDGTPKYLYHGIPCDIGRICTRWDWIKEYIEAIRERTVPSSPRFNRNFVLLMFDVKINELNKEVLWHAGEEFADIALIPLYKNRASKLKVMFSIVDFTLKDFIKGLLARLNMTRPDIVPRIGFELNSEENLPNPHAIQQAFVELGVPAGHIWLSEGVTNWWIPLRKKRIVKELSSLIHYRDSSDGYISKVYAWTVNFQSTAKMFLKTGIDGIISNNPRNVIKAMEDINRGLGADDVGEKLRLATLEDDPFERVKKL